MSEWHPIDTAPDEGFFLVANFSAERTDGWDCSVKVVYKDIDGRLVAHIDNAAIEYLYLDGPATHWMPLPNPPDDWPIEQAPNKRDIVVTEYKGHNSRLFIGGGGSGGQIRK
jgi:hypothetical protein